MKIDDLKSNFNNLNKIKQTCAERFTANYFKSTIKLKKTIDKLVAVFNSTNNRTRLSFLL